MCLRWDRCSQSIDLTTGKQNPNQETIAFYPTEFDFVLSFSHKIKRLQVRLIVAAVNLLSYPIIFSCEACLKCFVNQLHILNGEHRKSKQ